MEPNGDQTTNLTRFTVAQAADALGLSPEAVRMRIKRGTLPYVKEENTVYVLLGPSYLEADQAEPNSERTQPNANQTADLTDDKAALMDALRAEVEFLREELRRRAERHAEETRRKDHLLAAALERIPELEPPSEPRESPTEVSEASGKVRDLRKRSAAPGGKGYSVDSQRARGVCDDAWGNGC